MSRLDKFHRFASVPLIAAGMLLSVAGGLSSLPVLAQDPSGGGVVGVPPSGGVSPGVPVGTLSGTVSVGVSGGANWTTALKMVAGPGGVQPGLSIGYGGGGYGGLGVGFSLSGLSSISRCGHTHGQDDRAEAIDWTVTDRLCLDGDRLVAVSGTYGSDGAEYRPRGAGNVRVIARGSSVDPVSGFTVYTPDGGVSEYGVPSAGNWQLASVLANLPGGGTVPLSWSIRQVRDRWGNRMDYAYAGTVTDQAGLLTPQDQRIERIDYGANATAGTGATRRVAFGYGTVGEILGPGSLHDYDENQNLTAPDVQRGYVRGVGYVRRQLLRYVLQSVRTDDAAAWTAVREYGLDYAPVPTLKVGEPTDQVRLVSMRECDGSANCFPATKFEWSGSPVAQSWTAWPDFAFGKVSFYPPPAVGKEDEPYRRAELQVLGDFDADGVSDMLVSPVWENTQEGLVEQWELWRVSANAEVPYKTTIPAWSSAAWFDRTGGVVVPGQLVPKAEPVRTGQQRDGRAVAGAWAVNVDGTYGTDVLIGVPQLELGGFFMDAPAGVGGRTWSSPQVSQDAPTHCAGYPHLDLNEETLWQFWDCEQYLTKSPSDLTGHPGILSGFEVWRLKPGTTADFEKQALKLPAGRVALWAQPVDLNADRLTDLVWCQADADYGTVSGQAMPAYYRDQDAKTSWASGTLRYAVNANGTLDVSGGGTAVLNASGTQRCHYQDALYVLDLYGDGRESVLHRAHADASAQTVAQIAVKVPAGTVANPYPAGDEDTQLTEYTDKLYDKVYAEHQTGQAYYQALTYQWGQGVRTSETGLPVDEFMRWQSQRGNATARYSRYQPAQPGDVDAQADWGDKPPGRRVGWARPDALTAGGGLGSARIADVNRDGLLDIIYVDLSECHYATDKTTPKGAPVYAWRNCSLQDVMTFGQGLWEQTYEKLTVDVYANRGDGTFDLIDSQRWWDTDLSYGNLDYPDPNAFYTDEQLHTALVTGPGANVEENNRYKAAATIATKATRKWRTEFASSQIGDGNGDGVADIAYLQTVFHPHGNWSEPLQAGVYVVRPSWRIGQVDGRGFRQEPAPLMPGTVFDKAMPANETGVPTWAEVYWKSDGSPTKVSLHERHEYGLPTRWDQGDFNRDGVLDLMVYDHVEGKWRFLRGVANDAQAPAPQLLTAVVNGLGERTQIAYAPQHTLPATGTVWSDADLTRPYPLVSRPSNALAVATLQRDNGGEANGEPTYNTTRYLYGKSVSDVLRGVPLGIDRHESRQAVITDSGVVSTRSIQVYDTSSGYDAALKAYALSGTLLSQTSWVSGGDQEPIHLTHSGYRYEGKAGLKAGTWRRQQVTSTSTTYEVPGGQGDLALKLMDCLPGAYDAAKECVLGAQTAYQPLTHGTQWRSYDDYGHVVTQESQSAGTTTIGESTLKHQDTLEHYVLGLPEVTWTAHEPEPGVGYTLRTSAHSYEANGALRETTVEPDQVQYRHSQEFKYDAFGNVAERWLKSDVAGWQPTFYQYSPSGVYAVQVKNEKGHTTSSQWSDPYYEACGVAERVTGPAGHSQVTDIDTFCRTTGSGSWYGGQTLSPKVTTTYAEWEPNGAEEYKDVDLLVTTSVAGGASSHVIADRLGRTQVSQGPGFGFEVYTKTRYDALGRAQAVSLPTKVGEQPAGWTQTVFDALGRARQVTAADGTVATTAIDRYETTVTDALGHTSTSTLNALGQVVRVDPPVEDGEPALGMCYRYGAFGVLTVAAPCEAVAGKAPVTFKHDDYGRTIEVLSAATGPRTTQYDQLGRVWRSSDAKGQVTRFVYDKLGRVVERIERDGTPAAKSASWVYDTVVAGALTQATNAAGTVVERPYYDGYRRVAGLDTTIHGTAFSSRVDYDERGRVKTTTLPSLVAQDAVQVTTLYNGLDQVIGQTYDNDLLWEPVEANAFGQMVKQRYGNDLEAVAEYDPLNGRLATASVLKPVVINGQPAQPVAIERFHYDWYGNGLLERRTREGLEANAKDQSDTFYYNRRGELVSWTTLGANGAAQAQKMAYDGYGNVVEGPAGTYGYIGERLATVSGGNAGTVLYQYDANGNVTARDHNGTKTVIDYDALNRVAGVQDGSTQSTHVMTYNADGAKVYAEETASGRKTFYLGGYQREVGGKLGTQGVERMNLGPAHLSRTWAGNTHEDRLSYLTPADHLGSQTLVTDGQGGIEDQRSHGPWGHERSPTNALQAQATPQDDTHGVAAGYTGHERKQRAPGIIDMNARYYDSLTQRMLQADTVIPGAFNPLAWNGYAYAFNNPVAFTDPSGHAPQGTTGGGGSSDKCKLGECVFSAAQKKAGTEDFANRANAAVAGVGAAMGAGHLGGDIGAAFGRGFIDGVAKINSVLNAVKKYGSDYIEQQMTNAKLINPFFSMRKGLFGSLWNYHYANDFLGYISGDRGARRYFQEDDFGSMDNYKKAVYSSRNFKDLGIEQASDLALHTSRLSNSRKMTMNEVAAAKIIFGQSLAYNKIIIHKFSGVIIDSESGKCRMVGGVTSWGGLNIALRAYSSDMALDTRGFGVFAHELTHSWQAVNKIKALGPYNKFYGAPFGDTMMKGGMLNMLPEQQADLVGLIYTTGLHQTAIHALDASEYQLPNLLGGMVESVDLNVTTHGGSDFYKAIEYANAAINRFPY